MSTPNYRPGLGDDTERYIRLTGGYIEYRFAPGGTCEIVNIEVAKDTRRTGMGRKLLEMLFKEILGRATMVYAITRSNNEVAIQFYEATGFYVVGVLRRFYLVNEKGVDAIMYGRRPEGPV